MNSISHKSKDLHAKGCEKEQNKSFDLDIFKMKKISTFRNSWKKFVFVCIKKEDEAEEKLILKYVCSRVHGGVLIINIIAKFKWNATTTRIPFRK